MSETRFPTGSSVPDQSQRAAAETTSSVRIITLPEAIRAEAQTQREALRLQGEVVRVNDDNSVRVRTERGDIDLRPREGQPPPERGTRVEVEIRHNRSSGQVQETANIREIPRAEPQPAQTQPPARTVTTPVNVEVSQQTQQQAVQPRPADATITPQIRNTSAAQALPPEGSVVRLQPLPAQSIAGLPPVKPLALILSTLVENIDFQSQIISFEAVSSLQNSLNALLQTPAALAVSPSATSQLPAVLNTPVLSAPTPASIIPAQNQALIFQFSPADAQVTTSLGEQPSIGNAPPQPEALSRLPTSLINAATDFFQNLPELPRLPLSQNTSQTGTQVQIQTLRQISTQPIIQNAQSQIQPAITISAQSLQNSFAQSPALTNAALPGTPLTTNLITPRIETLDVFIERILPPSLIVQSPAALLTKTPALPFETGTTQNINPYIPQIFSAQPQAAAAPEKLILQNQSAAALNGVVTNITNEQLPVLTVFFPQISTTQVFAMQFPSESVTIGTQIQVTPQTTTHPQTAVTGSAIASTLPLPVLLTPATQWPGFEEMLQTLARAAPQTAQSIANIMPSPANPAQLGPALLFFIAAVRGGDLSQWLGDRASDTLRTQKNGRVMSRLMGEGQTLSRIAGEALPQDWRAVNLPLLWQGDVQKMALYYKHERANSDDEISEIKGTRFVFDLALENMGKVQLDGLFRPGRLDLVVRTQEHFSQNKGGAMPPFFLSKLSFLIIKISLNQGGILPFFLRKISVNLFNPVDFVNHSSAEIFPEQVNNVRNKQQYSRKPNHNYIDCIGFMEQ